VFDRSTLFVGSLNLDPRSVSLNTEMGVLVEIPNLTGPAVNALENSLAQNAYRLEFVPGPGPCKECGHIVWVSREEGREVRYTREPHASFWRRLQVNVFSLLPLESQL
jgi:putative cardiolipin synthase